VAPIAVYALANKYDMPALKQCAAWKFPSNVPCGKGTGYVGIEEAVLMVDACYSQCGEASSEIALPICGYVMMTGLVKEERFMILARKYPHLMIELFWAARARGHGRLWRATSTTGLGTSYMAFVHTHVPRTRSFILAMTSLG
jgi:hypothetical protein